MRGIFVAPFLPTGLTALGSPRVWCVIHLAIIETKLRALRIKSRMIGQTDNFKNEIRCFRELNFKFDSGVSL